MHNIKIVGLPKAQNGQQISSCPKGYYYNAMFKTCLPITELTTLPEKEQPQLKASNKPIPKDKNYGKKVDPYERIIAKETATKQSERNQDLAKRAGISAAAAAAIVSGGAALPYVAPALETTIAGVPGLTAGNLLNSYFAYEGAKNIPNVYNAWKQVGSKPTWSNIGNAAGETVVSGINMLPFGMSAYKGIPSVMQDINQAGEYLTTQTPLKNTYKLNPRALKQNPETFLYRAQPKGFNLEINDLKRLENKLASGESLTDAEKSSLNYFQEDPRAKIHQELYGKWFFDDAKRLPPYIKDKLKEGEVEILKTKLPKNEADLYSVKNNIKASLVGNPYEYVLPSDIIKNAEKFSSSEIDNILRQHPKPNWLRGYKPTETSSVGSTSNSIMRTPEGQIQFLDDAAYRNALVTGKKNVINYLSDPRYRAVVEHNQQLANRLGLNQTLPIQREMAQPSLYEARLAKINEPLSLNDPRSLEMDIINNNSSVGAQYARTLNGKGSLTIPRVHSPSEITRNTSHEVLHHIYPNLGEGYPSFTPLEAKKAKSAFKSSAELRKIEEANNIPYWYLDDVDELVPNSFDLANDLSIEKFQKYPGMESFKNMLNSYSGDKKFIRDALKLDNKRDYKRAWDMLSGVRLGVVPAVIGATTLQKQKKGGIIKDNRGQWAHPGEITEIQGNTMATHGYGNIPLYVIPDNGEPRVVQANTGTHKFPGATKFTEFPMMQKGGIPFLSIPEEDPEMIYLDRFNTSLNKQETKEFNDWVSKESERQGRNILMDKGAYDVQGFWKSGDYKKTDKDGHGTDTWKKPNHPTFSNQSKYHGVDGFYGGNWNPNGGYQPSKQSASIYGPSYYNRMFGEEPGRIEHLDASRFRSGLNAPSPLYYKQGGSLPIAQNGYQQPTTADSLFLLNNNKIIKNLLDKGVYKWNDKQKINPKDWTAEFEKAKKFWDTGIQRDINLGFKEKGKLKDYKKQNNKFIGTSDWVTGGGDDYGVPIQYVHPDIAPQFEGDLTSDDPSNYPFIYSYGYDPIAITPWNMLTKKEQEIRLKKYGKSGTPNVEPKSKNQDYWTKNDISADAWNNFIKEHPGAIGIDPNHVDKNNRHLPIYPSKPEPTLNKKVLNVQPIQSSSNTINPQLRTIEQPDMQMPSVQRGEYRTSYYDPGMKDWNERAFMSQEESDKFAQEMSQRGYPGSYGNVTQTKKYKSGGLIKYQSLGEVTGKNCRGKCWKPFLKDESNGSGGTGYVSNAPVTVQELIASGREIANKKRIAQRTKELQEGFPGLSEDDVAMAMGDSARVGAKLWNFQNLDKNIGKYNELKGKSINEAHQYLPYSDYFYKFYRPQININPGGIPVPLTVPEILSAHSSPQGYRQTVQSNYKQEYGGPLKKFHQGKMTGPGIF